MHNGWLRRRSTTPTAASRPRRRSLLGGRSRRAGGARAGGARSARSLAVETLEPRALLAALNEPPSFDPINDRVISEGAPLRIETEYRDADFGDMHTAEIDWGDGTVDTVVVSPDPNTGPGNTGPLSIRFEFLDPNGFFDTQEKKDLLQMAGDTVISRLADDLDSIRPTGGNQWTASFTHPGTGQPQIRNNLVIQRNQLIVFVGGRELSGTSLAEGGPGGFSASGSTAFVQRVGSRGEIGALARGAETDFGPWGGAITFNTASTARWYFGASTQDLQRGQSDFVSVAMHEVAHLLGFGTASSWEVQVNSVAGEFVGTAATAAYDEEGNPPLEPGNAGGEGMNHWARGTNDDGQETSMQPNLTRGSRTFLTELDYAALQDIGWDVIPENARGGRLVANRTFANDGTFNVTMTLEDSAGESATKSFRVTVARNDRLDPWRNPIEPLDVNGDSVVTPLDVLQIFNEANSPVRSAPQTGQLPTRPSPPNVAPPFLDVSGDNIVSAIDALRVVNWLNENAQTAGSGSQSGSLATLGTFVAATSDHTGRNAQQDAVTASALAPADRYALDAPLPIVAAMEAAGAFSLASSHTISPASGFRLDQAPPPILAPPPLCVTCGLALPDPVRPRASSSPSADVSAADGDSAEANTADGLHKAAAAAVDWLFERDWDRLEVDRESLFNLRAC